MNVKAQGYVKAGIALLVAILAALGTPLVGDQGFDDLTTQDWLVMLASILASGALVAFVQNVPGVAGGFIKALVGAASVAVTALVAGNVDGVLTTGEKVAAISAFVVGLSAVYQIPEPPPNPQATTLKR